MSQVEKVDDRRKKESVRWSKKDVEELLSAFISDVPSFEEVRCGTPLSSKLFNKQLTKKQQPAAEKRGASSISQLAQINKDRLDHMDRRREAEIQVEEKKVKLEVEKFEWQQKKEQKELELEEKRIQVEERKFLEEMRLKEKHIEEEMTLRAEELKLKFELEKYKIQQNFKPDLTEM